MKLLDRYFGKLKYVYTQRCGCSFMLALFAYFVIAIALWLSVANEPKRPRTEADDLAGAQLSGAVFLFCFLVVPILLRKKQ
ncbi:hypothetical protein EI77_03557 [Prosthecobacter fusiformis]|uniref:Uncharacterized protein n=1 Tax=Prosthecobacter fusiformis TaxID=48464 RepID=A0A4V3FEC5_9BACT|nr:hypothetical protein EI77_03557 [Prosthecobacter fusiformis]